METRRARFQGVANIIRFNWPFFVGAGAGWVVLSPAAALTDPPLSAIFWWALAISAGLTLLSLAVSLYVYDLSGLYKLDWLRKAGLGQGQALLNVHAGFDENSALLAEQLAPARLDVWDFYDPVKHTEPSIRRARAVYPPYPGTLAVSPGRLPEGRWEAILLLFAAHEIRNEGERALFFRELMERLAPGGRIVVTEHLRDAANSIAYHFGSLHFHTHTTWMNTFAAAGLRVEMEYRVNPFVTTFVLTHDLPS